MQSGADDSVCIDTAISRETLFWSRRRVIVATTAGLIAFVILPIFLVIAIVFVVQPVRVEGISMSPTLNMGDCIFVQKSFFKINRGDIVVFRYPKDPRLSFVKRIVGLPNDVLEVRAGKVLINGQMLQEPYVSQDFSYQQYDLYRQIIPDDSYFVMGDNRDASNDSRTFAPIERSLIYGKYVGRYWASNAK